jgi:hypothetical protein
MVKESDLSRMSPEIFLKLTKPHIALWTPSYLCDILGGGQSKLLQRHSKFTREGVYTMTELSRKHHRIGLLPIFIAFLTIGLLALLPQRSDAQNEYFFPPGVTFDQNIPSPEEFLGYPIGTFATRHDRIVAYFQELARLSDRATYQSIGQTYELRPMPVLTVTSPANHARLETIRQEHLASLEPGASPNGDIPAIAHLGYNIHGNENSAAESALLTAYWLVAGTGADHERYLNEGVYHIEPTLNPDGRGRWVHWTNMNRAEPFVADPLDREHNEGWPGGLVSISTTSGGPMW